MVVYGRDNNRVLFNFESGTYAQPSGASGNWIGLVTSHSPTENENVIEVRYAGTTNRNYGQLINGPKDYEGTLTFHPQNMRMFGFALGSVYAKTSGTAVSVAIVSEVNSDTLWAYTSGTNQLTNFPSFTVHDSKKGPTDGQQFVRTIKGCVVDSMSLKAANGEACECEVSYKAQSLTLGSKTTDIVNILDQDTTRPYIWSDTVFTLDGIVMNELNEITYSIENNVENRHYVNGSKVAQAMVPTMRNHSIELTMDANSAWGKTMEDYHKNGSVFNASLALTISSTENATFAFSGCKIMEMESASEAEGIDEFSMTIKPQTVSLIGSEATYYNFY